MLKARRRLPLALGVVTVAITSAAACSPGVSREEPQAPGMAGSAQTEQNPASALGPSACLGTGSSRGTGSWTVIRPRTLCGQPLNTTPAGRAVDEESLQAAELTFDPLAETANPGNYTSGFAAGYELPAGLGVSRFINVVALDGHFNTLAAVRAMASNSAAPGQVFRTMPPGPHGGVLECASYGPYTADCVFGTATTIAYITIDDTSRQLAGARTGATAVDIRNAVEVRPAPAAANLATKPRRPAPGPWGTDVTCIA